MRTPALDAIWRSLFRIDARKRAQLARDAGAELLALPVERRVQAALKAGFPKSWSKLQEQSPPLLAVIIGDDALRARFGADAIDAWLGIDARACVSATLPYADALPAETFFTVVDAVAEGAEAYEILAPRFRRDPELRVHIGYLLPASRAALSDARIVDLALEVLPVDAHGACALLRNHASPRAIEECHGVAERADLRDDAGVDAALAALTTLELLLPGHEYLLSLERFVQRFVGAGADVAAAAVVGSETSERVRWHVGIHRDELLARCALAPPAVLAFIQASPSPYQWDPAMPPHPVG